MSKITRTIVVDIDDTICKPNHGETDSYKKYGLARPIESVIGPLRKLHENGYKIILSTARRMVTHNGDIEKIINDVGDITENWLNEHNVPYDELVFGKPYGAYYIDDKAMTPEQFSNNYEGIFLNE